MIWDDALDLTITNGLLHHNVDYTPYKGLTLNAWPAITISRGEVVWDGYDRYAFLFTQRVV